MQHVYQQGKIVLRLITTRSFLIALENYFDDDITKKKRKEKKQYRFACVVILAARRQ